MGRWGPNCGQHRVPLFKLAVVAYKGGENANTSHHPLVQNHVSRGKCQKWGTHAITMVKERVVDWIIRFNS